MKAMTPVGPLAQLFKPLLTPGLAASCLGLIGAVAAAAWALMRWLPMPRVTPDLQPALTGLVVFAAFCYVMALLSLWGVLRPSAPAAGAGGHRAVIRRGRVVPDGEPLRSPLTGTPCVAYAYRAYRQVVRNGDRMVVWSYSGLGSMAFSLDAGDGGRVAVRAVPQLMDPPVQTTGPQDLARARRHVASTAFEPAAGLLGGVQVAAHTLVALTHQAVQPGQPYRRDWYNSQASGVDLQQLQFEEELLGIDAMATVVGHWNPGERAIVPGERSSSPTRAACTPQGEQALSAALDGAAIDGDAPSRPSVAGGLTAVVVMTLFGSGALALTRLL